jgi:hypothetical protein
MLRGIPCLVGYHATWDTTLSAMPRVVGYCAVRATTLRCSAPLYVRTAALCAALPAAAIAPERAAASGCVRPIAAVMSIRRPVIGILRTRCLRYPYPYSDYPYPLFALPVPLFGLSVPFSGSPVLFRARAPASLRTLRVACRNVGCCALQRCMYVATDAAGLSTLKTPMCAVDEHRNFNCPVCDPLVAIPPQYSRPCPPPGPAHHLPQSHSILLRVPFEYPSSTHRVPLEYP